MPSCKSPACVAAHIVAQAADGGALDDAARAEITQAGETDPNNLHGLATAQAASRALGLNATPVLFEGVWPVEWAATAGISNPKMDGGAHFIPTPRDAVAVLTAVKDGRLRHALQMSDIMATF